MTQITAENMEDLVPPPAEPAQVDEGQVRRKSMVDGAWKGIKRGLMWGGLAGVGLTTLGTVLAYSVGGTAVGLGAKGATGLLGLAYKLHPGFGVAATAIAGIFAGNAIASVSIPTLAMQAIGAFAAAALPVLAIGLVAGAAIGGIAGAVSGYMESDVKVEQEHRKAKQVAAQLNFERQQVMKQIMQEREMERQLAAQTRELHSGLESGQLHSPATPARSANDKTAQMGQSWV
jgi:hypothetical protein